MVAKLEVSPLSNLLGVEVRGVDLRSPIADALIGALVALLYRHAVVCIRDQELTAAQLAAFGERLGRPIHHNEENLRLDGLPGVMSLSNADDRDDRQLNGGAHWHTDLVHSDEPASFTMLHAVAVPRTGGGTLFADQVAAYEGLPPGRRREVDDAVLVHCYEGRTDGSMPTFRHRLVRDHPITGTKALYGAADTGIDVVGMPDAEARQFLDEIAHHATDPRFVYLHRYALNDLVIWDNARLLHAGERLARARSVDERRIMHRVSVRGWPQAPM